MSLETNEALALGLAITFLSQDEADEIRREILARDLVIDFYNHAQDMRDEQRAYRRNKVWGAIMASLVSILCVAAFIWLAIVYGA